MKQKKTEIEGRKKKMYRFDWSIHEIKNQIKLLNEEYKYKMKKISMTIKINMKMNLSTSKIKKCFDHLSQKIIFL